jgi:uncharacterized protein YkwD
MSLRPLLIATLSLMALVSVGCGGGGSSDSGGPTTPPTPPGAMMTAAELQLASDALAAMNAHRATKMLGPLTTYAAGAQVAYAHGLAMEAGNFFAHTDPGTGTTPASRASAAGIVHDPLGFIDPISMLPFVGENLAFASGTPTVTYTGAQAVNGWIGSPGHHTQIDAPLPVAGAQTMPPWTHCGIGVRVTPTKIWYTAMFFRNPN